MNILHRRFVVPLFAFTMLVITSLACEAITSPGGVSEADTPTSETVFTQLPASTPIPTTVLATFTVTSISSAPCRVAYVDKISSATADIFIQDCDGSHKKQVTKGRLSTGHEPAWSPDGQRLVFDESSGPIEPNVNVYVASYLYIVNADGSNRTQIIAQDGPAEGHFPVWSPDGTRIAWQSGCDIMTIHPDGSNKVDILDHHRLSEAGDVEMCVHRPMWSPDSKQFAFATFPLDAAWDVSIPAPYEYRFYVVNADGAGLLKLATFMLDVPPRGIPVEIWWSPDGKQVAFEMTTDDMGTSKRYLMNSDGNGELTEIDSIPESWHPWYWPQWGIGG